MKNIKFENEYRYFENASDLRIQEFSNGYWVISDCQEPWKIYHSNKEIIIHDVEWNDNEGYIFLVWIGENEKARLSFDDFLKEANLKEKDPKNYCLCYRPDEKLWQIEIVNGNTGFYYSDGKVAKGNFLKLEKEEREFYNSDKSYLHRKNKERSNG